MINKQKSYDYSIQKRNGENYQSDMILLQCFVKNEFHSVNYTYKDKILLSSNETIDIMVNRKDIVCVKSTIPTQVVVKGSYDTYKIYSNDRPESNEFTLLVTQPFSAIYNQLTRDCTRMPYDPYGYYQENKEKKDEETISNINLL